MKKRNLKALRLNKNVITELKNEKTKGGLNTNNCGPSRNPLCTFDDACFSKGPGCSRWQVC